MPDPDFTGSAETDSPTLPEGPLPPIIDSTASLGQQPSPELAGRYELKVEIARGGMGKIYRAIDRTLHREVAMKVLQSKYPADSGTARRFADEARITGQLQHPNIPAVHDLGTLPDGRPFLAMKLIKGQTLDELLKQRSSPGQDRGRLLAVFELICQALAYAHAHGVIHRDLKPGNIMVGSFGEVQVMDWGLAKVLANRRPEPEVSDPVITTAETEIRSLRDSDGSFTQAGSILGTPAYMPPEQALGAVHEIDAQSDVFGLGGILAAILTGLPPFVADTSELTRLLAAKGKIQDCFARLDASASEPELVALCKSCLAPEKAGRPANADVLAKALAQFRTAADERARQAELERARSVVQAAEQRKRRRVWGAAAAVLFTGVAAVAFVEWRANAELARKNDALRQSNVRERQRFNLALDAIGIYTGDVSKDLLLKEKQFEPLRRRLLLGAANFYTRLEVQLTDRDDDASYAALGRAYHELAELTAQIGKTDEALKLYEQARAVRLALAERPEADPQAEVNLAQTLIAAGRLQSDSDKPAAAVPLLSEAITRLEKIKSSDPTVRGAIAYARYVDGWANYLQLRYPEALASYNTARLILTELVREHPEVLIYQRHLSWCDNDLAIIWSEKQQIQEAIAALQRSLSLKETIARNNPEVGEYQRDVAVTLWNIANTLEDDLQLSEALAMQKKARDVFVKLAQENPAVTDFQTMLAGAQANIARVSAGLNQYDPAFAALESALSTYQKLNSFDPNRSQYQTQLAYCFAMRGRLRILAGRPAEGVPDLREGVRLYGTESLSDSEDRLELARALSQLSGFGHSGRYGVTTAEAAPFAARAIAILHEAVRYDAHRWIRCGFLKQQVFDPIREREDFQKLLAEAQAIASPARLP